jgi:membrane associated rhomboid family serine protease
MAFETAQRALVLALVALSLAAVLVWERDDPWATVRSRLAMGVPWGTLVVVGVVLAVYLGLQGGWNHWRRPVTLPFSAWTYLSPLGVATAAFAHDGPSHLLGNLTTAIVVLPLAEYAFGHFPTRRGASSFAGWRSNPWVRALVAFPAGVLGVGLLTALFSWGPVIGFSGVVFAAVGFALTRYPLATVVALVGQSVVLTAYRALLKPQITRQVSRGFDVPGWAGIAVQGHALGLFLGVTAGLGVLSRRRGTTAPPVRPWRLWLGATLSATSLSLWAVWWTRGGGVYVLFRAVGLAVVLVTALLMTAALVASDRPLVRPPRDAAGSAAGAAAGALRSVRARVGGDVTRRQAAVALFLVPLLVMALVAVPVNTTTLRSDAPPDGVGSVEVRDYTVVYAENVPNRMVNVVNVSAFGETTRVRTSGVVVMSDERNVWSREVRAGRLAANGRARVVVGGVGWRAVVVAVRDGWSVEGGGSAYTVGLARAGERPQTTFTSGPATADPVLAGYNVSVEPGGDRFRLNLSRNGTAVATAPMPAPNESVTLAGVRFARDGTVLRAHVGNTSVTVARKETYD